MKHGNFADAQACYTRVLALKPTFSEAHRTLGNAFRKQGLFSEAESSYRQALEIDPHDAESHNCLGVALKDQYRFDEAISHYRLALECKPLLASAIANLGTAYFDMGHLDKAIAHYRQALAQEPSNVEFHSQLLFSLLHSEKLATPEVFSAHVAFANYFETPLRSCWMPHTNSRDAERRLRVGFVSGDLRNHAVSHFIEPVWGLLDPAIVELWVYSNYEMEDAVTFRLRRCASQWHKVVAMSDDELAQRIRADGIDILIDLSGHTGHNRLMAFARKPAPVQATWIGYPGTTGLTSIDYVICDRFNAPHGLYEHYYTEKFARLPSTGAFAPSLQAPELSELPASKNGFVTFGSFNRPNKLGQRVIEVWSRVLLSVPESRLFLGNMDDAGAARALRERFAHFGIREERLSFSPKLPIGAYLALHKEVDIALDTWPYTGGTTTNHAVWMGVPVVTLRGPSRAHCQSAAVLGRMGLEDWIALNEDDFVRVAIERAGDVQGLAQLRRTMRERWLNSTWRNEVVIARGLEAGLRLMWQRWCKGLTAEHFEIGNPFKDNVHA
jgi:predicted O-linked N-acetylglucosamine transferase (SPINDLY family)